MHTSQGLQSPDTCIPHATHPTPWIFLRNEYPHSPPCSIHVDNPWCLSEYDFSSSGTVASHPDCTTHMYMNTLVSRRSEDVHTCTHVACLRSLAVTGRYSLCFTVKSSTSPRSSISCPPSLVCIDSRERASAFECSVVPQFLVAYSKYDSQTSVDESNEFSYMYLA